MRWEQPQDASLYTADLRFYPIETEDFSVEGTLQESTAEAYISRGHDIITKVASQSILIRVRLP